MSAKDIFVLDVNKFLTRPLKIGTYNNTSLFWHYGDGVHVLEQPRVYDNDLIFYPHMYDGATMISVQDWPAKDLANLLMAVDFSSNNCDLEFYYTYFHFKNIEKFTVSDIGPYFNITMYDSLKTVHCMHDGEYFVYLSDSVHSYRLPRTEKVFTENEGTGIIRSITSYLEAH